MNRPYVPNDSPYGDALRAWLRAEEGAASLRVYSTPELDEYASVTSALLGTPVYAEDSNLRAFAEDLDATILERGAEDRAPTMAEPPAPTGRTITLEPHWPGMREYVVHVARSDMDTARELAAAMGSEAPASLEPAEEHYTARSMGGEDYLAERCYAHALETIAAEGSAGDVHVASLWRALAPVFPTMSAADIREEVRRAAADVGAE